MPELTQTTTSLASWRRREYSDDFLVSGSCDRRSSSHRRKTTSRTETIAAIAKFPIATGPTALTSEQRTSGWVRETESPEEPTKVTAVRASA